MAGVDGKWNCTIATPMGDQAFTLEVRRAGDRFAATLSGGIGSLEVPDGAVEGDTLRWSMAVPKPMPLTLTCEATADGDALAGQVKAGIFGSYALTGTRA